MQGSTSSCQTTDDIEMRVCRDKGRGNEDIHQAIDFYSKKQPWKLQEDRPSGVRTRGARDPSGSPLPIFNIFLLQWSWEGYFSLN
jgi:hypothetical protein